MKIESRQPDRALLAFFVVLFALVITRRAWLSDDAYITFRTIDNFINGYGLTWNVGERVQAYTHPLWMFLLSGAYALTREIHFTSIFVSIAVSVAAVWLLVTRLAKPGLAAVVAVVALTLSKAYIDYATSGLENPLANLLLVLFAIQFIALQRAQGEAKKSVVPISLTISFLLLTRLDLLLLVAPAGALLLWQRHRPRDLRGYFMGALPLLAWEAFSLFYYGFPLPNTYYAKLNTGIPQNELTQQGFLYLLNALENDPLTLLLILFAIILPLTSLPSPRGGGSGRSKRMKETPAEHAAPVEFAP